MTTADPRQWPVYRQLQAYEESGTMDHANTQEGWAAEDTVAVGIATALLLERVNHGWRERAFRGIEPYQEEPNRLHQDLFVVWLRVTEALLERLARKDSRQRQVGKAQSAFKPPRMQSVLGMPSTRQSSGSSPSARIMSSRASGFLDAATR
jgi:hypothetical protein